MFTLAATTIAALLLPAPSLAHPGTIRPAADVVAVRSVLLDDPTIVAIFDAANTADMETGALAARKGSTKKIRDFGAMLLRDHTSVRQMGRDLAKKLGVTPTPPAGDTSAADHAAAMKHLESLSGLGFDRAFLEHEVAFHKAVIAAINTTLLPAIKNAELKALVVKVAPAFVGHQQAAEQFLKAMGSAK